MAHDIPIWQVARATSAAPTYFKPPVIDGLEYVDGGFGANNPCREIYEEVRRMNNNSQSCASIILSIGTGKNNEARRFKGTGFQRYLNYLNFARKWASDSEQTHLAMLNARSEGHFDYFRLNVEEGLDLMKLDEWRARGPVRTKIGERICRFRSSSHKDRCKDSRSAAAGETSGIRHIINGATTNGHLPTTGISSREIDPDADSTKIPQWFRPKNRTLDSIRKYTEEYLSHPDTIKAIERCAKLLVDGRRGRAKSDPQRWEKACFGTWYQCRIPECPRGEKEYERRWQLRKHLLDKHKAAFTRGVEGKRKLDEALDSCKIVVH